MAKRSRWLMLELAQPIADLVNGEEFLRWLQVPPNLSASSSPKKFLGICLDMMTWRADSGGQAIAILLNA